MTDIDEIEFGIKKLRRRKRLPLITVVVFLPVLIFLSNVFTNDLLIVIAAIIYVVSFTTSFFVFAFTKCPKCSRYFQGFWGLFNPFTYACVHCGLRIKEKTFFNP